MAIQWGPWEYGSGNGMRVGIDVSWSTPLNGGSSVTATVDIYTQNQYSYSDGQTLSYAGSITGSTSFTNNDGGSAVLRATKTYTYTYASDEYGSSPGSRTFQATLSGAFNGITPSKTVASDIPARPYASPNNATNVGSSRISDTAIRTTWTNNATNGRPWDSIDVQRDDLANDIWNDIVGTPSGAATGFTDSTVIANRAWRYRVRPKNSVANGDWIQGDLIYTTPAAPTDAARTPGGTAPQQVVSWTNNVHSSITYQTEVYVTRDGGSTWNLLTAVASGVTSYTDTAASAAQKTAYRVRAKTNGGSQGTLYSAYSGDTTYTVGTTSAPNAPTALSPSGNLIIAPAQSKTFTWQFNSTDTTPQTAYQIQYRVIGAGSWTTLSKTTSSTSSWTAPGGQFADNSQFEWQVRTWGSATTGGSDGTGASAWSTSGTFKTVGDPNAARALLRVMRMNLESGDIETAPAMVLPPIGSIMDFAGAAAPEGWLLCNGQAVSRSTYSDLFAVIGTTFGAGDGSTTFNVPDYRDRGSVGVSATKALGSTGGSGTVTLSVANLPPHTHANPAHSHGIAVQWSSNTTTGQTNLRIMSVGGQGGTGTNSGTGTTDTSGATTSGSGSGTSTPFSVQDPYIALNKIIRT